MKKIIPIVILFFFTQLKAQITPAAYKEFKYKNTSCSAYTYGEGTLISIPENAFFFENGTSCTDSVTIKYREFHSQTDMFVNKLNMVVLRNGKKQMLESAGMFELRAECSGKPLIVAPGKTIQVRMKCRRNLPNLEAFIYNEKQNVWLDYGQVFEFSVDKNKLIKPNENTNVNWGSSPLSAKRTIDTVYVDQEGAGLVPMIVASSGEGDNSGISDLFNQADLPDGIFKGMNLKNVGLFNYDAVIGSENAIAFVPDFSVNSGNEIGLIYVSYEKRNMLINYYPDDFAERFVLLNEKGIKIFTKLSDGSFAVLKEGTLDAIDLTKLKGTTFKMVLEKQPLKPKTIAELAKVTKMNVN